MTNSIIKTSNFGKIINFEYIEKLYIVY